MLMTAVIDPSVLQKEFFDDNYRAHVEIFLRGMQKNVLLLVDQHGILKESLFQTIQSLPDSLGQNLKLWITELIKNDTFRTPTKQERIVEVPANKLHEKGISELREMAYEVKGKGRADGLIATKQGIEELKAKKKYVVNLIDMAGYIHTEFEAKREKLTHKINMYDNPEYVEEAIVRSLKFTKWINFYDKMIGKTDEKGGRRFLKGLEYILDLQNQHGEFSRQNGRIIIFTCMDPRLTDSYHKNKLTTTLKKCLLDPLKRKYREELGLPWSFEIRVKDDPGNNKIIHDRYLQTQLNSIEFSHGFDFLREKGEFSASAFIELVPRANEEYIRAFFNLPDVIPPIK